MIYTVCHRHQRLTEAGSSCPDCKREQADRGKPRRQANKTRLGRSSRHWRELSFRMIRRHRETVGPVCPACRGVENDEDTGSKLTLDLIRGGDHTTAGEHECRVLCRRCHGRQQGGVVRGGRAANLPDGSSRRNTPAGRV